MDRVAIALGSNLGDRRGHIDYAVASLQSSVAGLKVSSYYETEPVGTPDSQSRYLNAAAVGETAMSAREMLDLLHTIERERGRERPFQNAARTLDLDLILYGDTILNEPDLEVPHPRFRDRPFVVDPLKEIAPDLIDPVTGKRIAEMTC